MIDGPAVHTSTRRHADALPLSLEREGPVAGLPFQIAPLSCSASPVSLAGGTASQLPACLAPIPIPHLPSMSHHPMSQFVACSLWWFPVRSQRVHWCRLAVSPPRSGHHLLRVPALVPAPPNPPNPRSTQQPLKSLAAQCPRLITNQTHPWSIRRCIPLCYLCRGLEVSYPLLSHPRPCRSSGRCVMEEAYCRAFGLGRPAANTDVTLCRRSLGRFLQRLAPWILPNAARLQVLHNILSVLCQSEK